MNDNTEAAIEVLESAQNDWEYLSEEEKFGTIDEALTQLEKERETTCDGCGREVTLMGNGRCGHCQPSTGE